jgi:nicotinate-nucleotide adenylyltransferase
MQAAKNCDLEKVFFLPERQPRHKTGVTDINHRVEMLKLAIAPHGNLEVLELPDTQLSVNKTLPKLQKCFADTEIALLLGSDAVNNLRQWKNLDKLLANVSLVIALRAGANETDSRKILDDLNVKQFIFVPSPRAHMASSKVREGSTGSATHSSVKRYITHHKLYRNNT